MPTIDLTDLELIEAARGARCLQVRAEADRDKQTNPDMRATFERAAQFHAAMAAKFENARRPPQRPTPRPSHRPRER